MPYSNLHTAARRYGDTIMCSDCGKQWDFGDDAPDCSIEHSTTELPRAGSVVIDEAAVITKEEWAELKEAVRDGRPYRERTQR